MSNTFKVVGTGFLYAYRGGKFTVHEGRVLVRDGYHYSARFYVGERKFYQCSPVSGALEHSCVWLAERDDDKARDMFVAHEEKKIAQMKRDIDRRETIIKTIYKTKLIAL